MATDNVRVNREAADLVLKKLTSTHEMIMQAEKEVRFAIDMAEVTGWTDKNYETLKDEYFNTAQLIHTALRNIEENHIPFVKKVIKAMDEF